MRGVLGQSGHDVRFEQGEDGARSLSTSCAVAVVVDVLSFTTTLSVALDRGVEVLPYPWTDGAADHAAHHHADVAVRRVEVTPGRISLSPTTIRAHPDPPARLVLPSPNGSSISFALANAGVVVVGGCLRNADAVAQWLATSVNPANGVAVIAAGEKWPGGNLRPAVEDVWGAGAIIAALKAAGWTASVEADAAATVWEGVRATIEDVLPRSGSGRELIAMGYPEDVDIASEYGTSSVVPILRGDTFVAATP